MYHERAFLRGTLPGRTGDAGCADRGGDGAVRGDSGVESGGGPGELLHVFRENRWYKFRHKVVPGDTLVFKLVKIAPIRRGIVTMRGYAFVGKTLVCEVGEFMAQVAKTKK